MFACRKGPFANRLDDNQRQSLSLDADEKVDSSSALSTDLQTAVNQENSSQEFKKAAMRERLERRKATESCTVNQKSESESADSGAKDKEQKKAAMRERLQKLKGKAKNEQATP